MYLTYDHPLIVYRAVKDYHPAGGCSSSIRMIIRVHRQVHKSYVRRMIIRLLFLLVHEHDHDDGVCMSMVMMTVFV